MAVVGGGVIGAACARAAALHELQVGIFEPGPDPAAASPASAGMLAAQIEPSDEAMLGLSVRARDLYEALAPALADSTGIDIGYWRAGVASIALDDEDADRLRDAAARQRQAGLRCDWLDPGEVHERWPGVAPECRGALFAPEDGAVDPRALTRAFLADARRLGAALVPDKVEAVKLAGDKVAGVVTSSGTVPTKHVVIAAGAWSPLLAGLPHPLPVEPVRGQMAATPWPDGTPPTILYTDDCYVLARGGSAMLGSTLEHAGFECRVTNEGLAQIFRGAVRLLPALLSQPVERTWAGLRPGTPDGRPIIGRDADVEGLWYATGHGRNGVLLAGLTGEVIGDLLTKGESEIDVSHLQLGRPTPGP